MQKEYPRALTQTYVKNKIVAIIAILIGGFILFMNYQETTEKTKIDKEGTETPAVVVEKHETRGRKGRVTRDFSIGYFVGEDQKPFKKKVNVSKELYEKMSIRDELKVKYLKADPNQVIIVGEPLGDNLLYAIGAAVLLFGIGSTWWHFIRKPTA